MPLLIEILSSFFRLQNQAKIILKLKIYIQEDFNIPTLLSVEELTTFTHPQGT